MSLRIALQIAGVVLLALLLLEGLVMMGPIGWIAFGALLIVGIAQVYRSRRSNGRTDEDGTIYCANCGEAVDPTVYDAESDDGDWSVDHCRNCGAPVPAADRRRLREPHAERRGLSCSDCGAPNDLDRINCTYCGEPLERS